MGQLLTSTQLYPPTSTQAFHTFLRSLTDGERDESGNFVLRRNLTPDERGTLRARAAELAPWLVVDKRLDGYRDAFIRMMRGFGSAAMTDKEADAIVKEYVSYAKVFPLWAVERACRRFGAGEVAPGELGVERLDVGFKPSTAQFATIARELVRPFGEESTRISMTARGTVARNPDEAERARVGEKLASFADALKLQASVTADEDRAAAVQRTAATDQFNRRAIVREYASRGLVPRYDSNGVPCSLALLLSVGWTIQEGAGGYNLLVAPEPLPPGKTQGEYGESR